MMLLADQDISLYLNYLCMQLLDACVLYVIVFGQELILAKMCICSLTFSNEPAEVCDHEKLENYAIYM